MRESWGKGFPSDYRKFIEVYGYGAIESHLEVLKPELKEAESATSDMANATWEAEDAWSWARKSP